MSRLTWAEMASPQGAKRDGDAPQRLGVGGAGPGLNAVRTSGVSTFFTPCPAGVKSRSVS